MKQISPSSLSIFKECPQCFWLDRKGNVPRPRGLFPGLPSGIDKILKEYFDSYRVKNEMPPELEEIGSDFKLFPDMQKLAEWRNSYKGIRCTIDGHAFAGALDDLLQKDGKYSPFDYKTKGFPFKQGDEKYNIDQMNCYTLLLEMNNYHTTGEAFLLYVNPETVMNTPGCFGFAFDTTLVKVQTDKAAAEKLVKDAISVLHLEEPPKPSPDCEYHRWARGALTYEH